MDEKKKSPKEGMTDELRVQLSKIIDVDSAIAMFGCENIYTKCIQSYAEEFATSFKEVHDAWKSQKLEPCEKTAHKFKGSTM
jgi:hypothetical protein